jgi:hypothetical protein
MARELTGRRDFSPRFGGANQSGKRVVDKEDGNPNTIPYVPYDGRLDYGSMLAGCDAFTD